MKRIGLFAGVFDPIHLGHTKFIDKAIRENGLDKVYVLIEREPKYKKCIASYKHRKEMVLIANKNIDRTEVYEPKSPSFPITSSLPAIRRANPGAQFFLLLGDDVAAHVDEWEAADQLKGVGMIVARRNTDEPYSGASSLKVREKIKSGQEPELDSGVLEYCRQNKLY